MASSSSSSNNNLMVVFCGPSGSGKSTLMKKLMGKHESKFGFSVSHTSRSPRPGETDGVDYHYSDRASMDKLREEGGFVETAEFSGNVYGTSKEAVRKVVEGGKVCLLDIDVQGVRSLRTALEGDGSGLLPPLKVVFVRPPSLQDLERRLRDRGTEEEGAIQKRLATASSELDFCSEEEGKAVDFVLTNDEVEEAYKRLEEYLGGIMQL